MPHPAEATQRCGKLAPLPFCSTQLGWRVLPRLNVVMSGTRQTPGLAVSELEFRCSQEGRAWETDHTHRAPVELITASGMKCGGTTCTEEAALREQSKFLPLPGWDPGDQSLTQDTEGAWSKCGCAKGLWASLLLL